MPRTINNANPTNLTLGEYTNLIISGLQKLRITPDPDLLKTGYYQQALDDELTINDAILELAADHAAKAPALPHGAFETALTADDPSGSRVNSWPVHLEIQKSLIGVELDGYDPLDKFHRAGVFIEHYDGEVRALIFASGNEEPDLVVLKTREQMNAEVQTLLTAFNEVPRTENNTLIAEPFFIWPANTPVTQIEEWFEEPEA